MTDSIRVWWCDECGYWRKDESTRVHQTEDPKDPRGRLVTHQLRLREFVPNLLPPTGVTGTLRVDVGRYPHFLVPAGSTGTVVRSDKDVIAMRMDDHVPGAESWDNEIHWYPVNGDRFHQDVEIENA